MSYKKSLILFSVLFACAKSQESNHLCPCDTESDQKDNSDLWTLLKKLSNEVSKENEALYAVPPGNLFQFDCSRCDEKLRKKRRIFYKDEVEEPVEVPQKSVDMAKKSEEEEELRDKRNIVHPKLRFKDPRCPKDTILIARSCVPIEDYDDDESADK